MLRAVELGSKEVSPFLHFSWGFTEARHWYVKGKTYRGEGGNLICRVPLSALSQAADLRSPLASGSYVDLATQASAQGYIAPHCKTLAVEDRLHVLGHAQKVKEVLVAWRGRVPRHVFEVVDENTGEFVRMLQLEVVDS